jgi:hypothetical protein
MPAMQMLHAGFFIGAAAGNGTVPNNTSKSFW